MSRATDLAKLPRHRVLAVWARTFPRHVPSLGVWAGQHATKEQLVAQIVTEEERCQQPPPK